MREGKIMLNKIYKLEIEIELLTGLHIGGSSDTFDIGGADATVIKNPLTHEPYIPGSSLKGKLRALLTYRYGKIEDNEVKVTNQTMLNLFEPIDEKQVKTSRAIFRDAYLTKQSSAELQHHLGVGNYTEIKAENSIDLLKGKAANPRMIERVPAGARFSGEIILHIFDEDDENQLKSILLEGITMLENNYIGGSGTRGYGRIRIHHADFMEVNVS